MTDPPPENLTQEILKALEIYSNHKYWKSTDSHWAWTGPIRMDHPGAHASKVLAQLLFQITPAAAD